MVMKQVKEITSERDLPFYPGRRFHTRRCRETRLPRYLGART